MIKKVTIEAIEHPERFTNSPLLTKEEVEQAIQQALKQLEVNLDYFKEAFQLQRQLKMCILLWIIRNGPMVFGQGNFG